MISVAVKRYLRLYIGWTRSRAARATLFASLLALASHWSTDPVGLVALVVALCLSAAEPRLGLVLLFAASFLPYVYGFPVTAGFVIIAALTPYVLFNLRIVAEAPRILVGLVATLLCLIAATFPFHKSPDLQFLGFAVVGLVEAYVLIRLAKSSPEEAWSDISLGFLATFLIPFWANMALLLSSPFFVPKHLQSLATYRVTISVIEPNVVAAYLCAGLTALVFTANLKGKDWKRHLGRTVLVVGILSALVSSGSRATLVLSVLVVVCALAYASLKSLRTAPKAPFCWPSIRLVSLATLLFAGALFGSAAATGKVKLEGIERLFATTNLEETGRPKSLRDARDRLDDIPYTGMDVNDYVLRTGRHSPHSSLVASAMFLGVWVSIPAMFLMLFPVFDACTGLRISTAIPITLALLMIFLGTLMIPATSDRGAFVLLGVWFAFAKFPRRSINKHMVLQT
jgi:hypothetical protein